MQRTIIMDTSFLSWLDRFDGYCRQRGQFLGLAKYQMPIETLDYLLEQGCNLVIPNEVLKELTQSDHGRVGISVSEDGEAYLDHALIEAHAKTGARNLSIFDWLREKSLDHRLDCCADGEDFWHAAQGDAAHGRVTIAAFEPPAGKGGFEQRSARDKNMIGDYEIENLFALAPHQRDTHLLLSNDYELNDNVRAASPNVVNVDGSGFMEMAALSGFIHDFSLYPHALQQFRKVAKDLPVGRPSEITHRRMSDALAEWGLNRFRDASGTRPAGFATTLQDRQLMAQRESRARG